MSPLLLALLGLGFCLSQRIKAQNDNLPKTFIWAEPDHLMPEGELVTIWCQSPLEASSYKLEQEGTTWSVSSYVKGNMTSFLLGKMRAEAAGVYHCQYCTSSGCSESSDSLMLIMIGWYEKPVLSARPRTVVVPGETVTLHCQSLFDLDGFMLSKNQGGNVTPRYEWHTLPSFTITAVTAAHGGTYRCHVFQSAYPYVWSAPSNPLVLRVTDTPEDHSLPDPKEPDPTNNPAPQDYTMGNLIRLSLAGLVLIILGVLLAEAWKSRRGP
ncbi:leukocyte immunoglobulin-like receptor subfamily A member 5 isoform X1 [Macrotis lagotis]|uniref:leukocyte immunoglobulin-like receptor subfamily A member 5 isoform X1 n=1 Tax=Macrotis lagotis TaxID=92651 RepID=UPI003D69EA10